MVTREERRWIMIFATVAIAVTSIPYLVGFWTQGGQWVYSGFVFGVGDGNSYIAKMLAGAAGSWLFTSPYTAYPQSGILAFLPYLLLGKLSAPPDQHVQMVVLFQIFRVVADLVMCFGTYEFIAYFIPDMPLRRIGTAIAILGGGLGWLSVLGLKGAFFNGLPLEFYSPETFGFLSFFGLPHLALGRGLLLYGLVAYLGGQNPTKAALRGGLLWLGLGLMQPLTVLAGWVVLGSHLALLAGLTYIKCRKLGPIDWTAWKLLFQKALGIGLISSPIVLYTFFAFQMDPILRTWQQQNIITSPPPLDYLLAYLLLIPLAIYAMTVVMKHLDQNLLLLCAWVLLIPILAYIPYNLQRRLPEGSWVALTALGMAGMIFVPFRFQRWVKAVLFSSFLPAIILLAGTIAATLGPADPLFFPTAEVKAFEALASHSKPGDVVLAEFDTSNILPAFAPVRTLVGHGPESAHLAEIQPRVTQFLQKSGSEQDRIDLIHEFNIQFIILGPLERADLGIQPDEESEWIAVKDGLLSPIYQKDGYSIYRVNPAAMK